MIRDERATDPPSAEPMKISDIHSNGGSQNLMNSQSRRTAHNIGGKVEGGKQKAERRSRFGVCLRRRLWQRIAPC